MIAKYIKFLIPLLTVTITSGQPTERLDRYSNYDAFGRPQLIEKTGDKLDSINGFREELQYDERGNIVQKKLFSKVSGKIQIESESFKYDRKNNIIEIVLKSEPKVSYPIYVDGGLPLYEREEIRYIYNKFGYWIKRKIIVNGETIIVDRRNYK